MATVVARLRGRSAGASAGRRDRGAMTPRSLALAVVLAVGSGCALLAPFPPLADDVAPLADGEAGPGSEAGEDSASESDGGARPCEPGTTHACFPGPPASAGVGICRAGTAECLPDGGEGPCVGAVPPAPERCDTDAVDETCDGEPGCTGAHRWAIRAGDASAQVPSGIAIAADGSVVVVGRFSGSLILPAPASPLSQGGDPSKPDGFVLALDPATGAVRWAHATPDVLWAGVATSAKGIAVAGNAFGVATVPGCPAVSHTAGVQSDVIVAWLKPDGTCRVARSFGDASAQLVTALTVDPVVGDVVLLGTLAGAIDFGGGTPVLDNGGHLGTFFARLDDDLVGTRAVRFFVDTTVHSGRFKMNAVTSYGGRAAVVGGMTGWMFIEPSGLSGGKVEASDVDMDTFVVTIDHEKTPSSVAGGPHDQESKVASFDRSGNLLVAGTFRTSAELGGEPLTSTSGTDDLFLARFVPAAPFSLVHEASVALTGPGIADAVLGITADPLGNVVLAGSYRDTLTPGGSLDPLPQSAKASALLAKYAVRKTAGDAGVRTDLVPLWARGFVGLEDRAAYGVTTDALGDVFVAGGFAGDLDVGGGTVLSAAGSFFDLFVLRRAP